MNLQRTFGERSLMLIWLVELADHFQVFNLFRYITFRTGAALFTSAIDRLPVRDADDHRIAACASGHAASRSAPMVPQTHFKKAGTPTMGGLMILAGIVGSCAALGRPLQCLCGRHAARHAGLRRHRLLRRLFEGHETVRQGLFRQGAPRDLEFLIAGMRRPIS